MIDRQDKKSCLDESLHIVTSAVYVKTIPFSITPFVYP